MEKNGQRTYLLRCQDENDSNYDVFFFATPKIPKSETDLEKDYKEAYEKETDINPEEWLLSSVIKKLRRKGWYISSAPTINVSY